MTLQIVNKIKSTKYLRILLLSLLSMTGGQEQDNSCFVKLAQDEDFMRCSQNFRSLINGAMDLSEVSELIEYEEMETLICNPKGKVWLSCIIDYISKCPEIGMKTNWGVQGLLLEKITNQGIDVFCELGTSETCRLKLEECSKKINWTQIDPIKNVSTSLPEMEIEAPYQSITPYDMMPIQMVMVCGPMYEMYICIMDVKNECPETTKYMEKTLEEMSIMQQEEDGSRVPLYSEYKNYIIESCPNLPDDFQEKERCMTASIEKQEFQRCYKNAANNEKNNCDLYLAGKDCLLTHVGDDCGNAYANAIASASPFFSTNISSGCEWKTNGASSPEVSYFSFACYYFFLSWVLLKI